MNHYHKLRENGKRHHCTIRARCRRAVGNDATLIAIIALSIKNTLRQSSETAVERVCR